MTRWKFCEIIFRGDKGKFRIVRGLYAERLSYTYAVVWEHDNDNDKYWKKQQINWMKNVRWYRGERTEKRSNILWGDNKSRDYLHAALTVDSINLTIKLAVLLKFSTGGKLCVWAFRSHGTTPNVRKFERPSV